MLLHNIPTRTFRIFRRILIMYINLRVLTYRYNSPQIRIPLITQLRTITRPTSKPSYHTIMFLELFHFGTVFDIYCIDTSITVTDEEFSLSVIEDHCG